MKNIFLVLILLSSFAFSNEEVRNKILINALKKDNPTLYLKLEEALGQIKSDTSKDVIYLFTSASVPVDVIKEFIFYSSILNHKYKTKVNIVFQGFTSKEFEEKMIALARELEEYEYSDLFIKNFNRQFDPQIFKELNINKVPAIGFASHKGNDYPSDADMLYLARGENKVIDLFKLIYEREGRYEDYYNTLSNYFNTTK